MAGPWLYLISAGAGRNFTLADGHSIPVTVNSYRTLLENGRIVEDLYWYISQNWNNIKIGDEVFVYTGDEDLGIIGYAKVSEVKQRADGWCILPKFDLGRSLVLLEKPVPAAIVRDWVPFLRKSPINLAAFEEQLRAHLPWKPLASESSVVTNFAFLNESELASRHYFQNACNHPKRWATFTPNRIRKFISRNGTKFCLVIVGDKVLVEDYYAIPWEAVAHLFVDDNCYPSLIKKTGKVNRVWKVHLHGPDIFQFELARSDPRERPVFDASEWHGNRANLLDVTTGVPSNAFEPTTDPVVLEQRVQGLRARGKVARPKGNETPKAAARSARVEIERLPAVKAWILQEAKGICELCQQPGPFLLQSGERYLEVHHVDQLSSGGADIVENAVALCPNCHRLLHCGMDAHLAKDKLYKQVSRILRNFSSAKTLV